MRAIRRPSVFFIAFVAAVVAAGCSDSYGGRMEVSGTVKLQGQLLQDGLITLVPLEGQDTQSGSLIKKGAYKIPRQTGLKPGKYLVQITSGDGKTPANEDIAAPGITNIVSMDRIPEDWNSQSKHRVEVKSTGANKFDFDIPNVNTPRKR
jgi:hypothetical protein